MIFLALGCVHKAVRYARYRGWQVSAAAWASPRLDRDIVDTRQLSVVGKQPRTAGGLARRPVFQNCFAILENGELPVTDTPKYTRKIGFATTNPMTYNKAMSTPRFTVGIGSSAGGLEALQELLGALPRKPTNASFIVAQHLSPTHKSMLTELLARVCPLTVQEAKHGETLQTDVVYITPPDTNILVKAGVIHLQKPISQTGPKPSVDILFHSLAADCQEYAAGIVLSGTGRDGSKGCQDIKREGGLIIIQDPITAKYDGMPQAALSVGLVDAVLPPDRILPELLTYLEDPQEVTREALGTKKEDLQTLLEILGTHRGVHFQDYKQTTILRRIQKRLTTLKLPTLPQYLEFIDTNPGELDILFQTLLIGVTHFFRDAEAFLTLKDELRKLMEQKPKGSTLRVWVPGCSTGEEAYTLAIIAKDLASAMDSPPSIQIFATDLDTKAIDSARKGHYSPEALIEVPQDLLDTYFTQDGQGYTINKNIRQLVLFSRHDLTENPPFLRLDLISCRNLLIYFTSELQHHVLPVFHYALNNPGLLFLGKSETIGPFTDLFNPVHPRHRIFSRRTGEKLVPAPHPSYRRKTGYEPSRPKGPKQSISDMVKETLFTGFEHPYAVINNQGQVLELQGDTSPFLGLRPGLLDGNITNLVHPALNLEVRNLLGHAVEERKPRRSAFRTFQDLPHTSRLRITVAPLLYSSIHQDLYIIIFEILDLLDLGGDSDARPSDTPGDGTIQDNTQVAALQLELDSAREDLQNYIEELETSNEELQSLNEELQSTNEELQSSNEELETSNEELQSSNEELQVAYTELRLSNTRLEEREQELGASRERLELALWGGDLAWWDWDIPSSQVNFADNKVSMLGYNPETFPRTLDSFLELVHPEDYDRTMEAMRNHLEGKTGLYEVEYRIRCKDGSYIWFWDKGQVVSRSSAGKPLRVIGVVINVDRRKRTEIELARAIKEREILLREIHHRVKNNFQMISSLLELQLMDVEDRQIQQFLSDTKDRITSMALIHRELYQNDDLGGIQLRGYLEALMENILFSYPLKNKELQLKQNIQDLRLPIDAMIPLALILNEIMTNSLKYAFPEDHSGPKDISLSIRQEDGSCQVEYSDTGVGIPEEVVQGRRQGMGMRLVTSLTRQLAGSYRFTGNHGTRFELSFPLNPEE